MPDLRDDSPSDESLRVLAWVVTLVPVTLGIFSGFQRRAYDSYIHMFFADHYRHGWFQLWEPRWYGGFSVASYPPLTHQLLALLSYPLGLEGACVALTAVVMLAMPLAVRSAARAFVDDRTADWAMLIAALIPTSQRFAYVYGQLPMLTATPFVLFSVRRLSRYLESGKALELFTYLALIGATAGAHHLSTLFAAGGAVLVAARALLPKERRGQVLGRALLAAGLSAVTLYVVILPFWRFARGEVQAEIPHNSRLAIWDRGWPLDTFEQLAFLAVTAALIAWSSARRRWTVTLLGCGALLFFVLGLGSTTPLPELIFRAQARWLTYDKFHYWGSLWFAVLLGWGMTQLSERWRTRAGWILAAVLLPPSLFYVGHQSSDAYQPERIDDLSPIVAVLNGPQAERYRHLSLGFGDQFCRIDIESRSPNWDGDYHTARRDPALRQSGIATLDAAKYYAAGKKVLGDVLDRATSESLRWVFSADDWYEPLLFDAGFELKEVWSNGVTLYEREDALALPQTAAPPIGWPGYLWGLAPLTCLGLSLLLAMASAERTSMRPSPKAA